MSLHDPLADLLTRIRNAYMARQAEVNAPLSQAKVALAQVLKEEGYISGFAVIGEDPQRKLQITLKYGTGNRPAIEGLQRVSRPSRRVYVGHDEIPKVMSGLGINILSTSRGIMSDRLARQKRVGGEILCAVW